MSCEGSISDLVFFTLKLNYFIKISQSWWPLKHSLMLGNKHFLYTCVKHRLALRTSQIKLVPQKKRAVLYTDTLGIFLLCDALWYGVDIHETPCAKTTHVWDFLFVDRARCEFKHTFKHQSGLGHLRSTSKQWGHFEGRWKQAMEKL